MGGAPVFKEALLTSAAVAVKNPEDKLQDLKRALEFTLKSKWMIIQMERMERLLSGELLDASVSKEWLWPPEELSQAVGLSKMNIEEFETTFDNFIDGRYTAIIKMVENEDKVIRAMLECDFLPSNPRCSELADKIKLAREKLGGSLNEHLKSWGCIDFTFKIKL